MLHIYLRLIYRDSLFPDTNIEGIIIQITGWNVIVVDLKYTQLIFANIQRVVLFWQVKNSSDFRKN
jgi:hypothetical protein